MTIKFAIMLCLGGLFFVTLLGLLVAISMKDSELKIIIRRKFDEINKE